MPRHLTTTFLTALLFCFLAALGFAADKPNVLVILSDDQGWGDLSLNGNSNLSTPRIDSLARDGARFDWFYVCPVCSPTRAEFLTGRYHPKSGVYSTSAGGERMDADERTIAETFRAAGYATAAYGKWHNGMQHPYHPNARGFDDYYGFCSGHWGNYFDPVLEHNGRIVRGKGFVIDDFTDHAIAFMQRHQQQPFFIYLPLNTPHSPMQVPDRWWNNFKNKELAMRHRDPEKERVGHTRAALAMCENIDWNVGRLLDKLDVLGLSDNTIVVYFCDNGPNGSRWNGGMKGRKGSTDEGGVRSPLLIRWPKRIGKGVEIKPIAAAIDLLPTLADLADISVVGDRPLDGISVAPLLEGKVDAWPDRTIVSHWRGRISVRNQRFRLDHQDKLFDMHSDPQQRRDVANQHPDVVRRLAKEADAYRRATEGYDLEKRPFPIGHGQATYTQLPARDAKATGNIKRSNRFPNCSYFTNWVSTQDTLSWDAEVASSGRYEVELYYACPKSDVGSTIELSFNDSRLQTKITTPHDPPQIGARQDRIARVESYVKDFKPLSLGVMKLEQGRGTLTLQALDIPGKQALEFRLLMLKRIP